MQDLAIMGQPTPGSMRINSPYLVILMNTLEPYLTYHIYPNGKRFSFSASNQPDCYFVRQGLTSLHRQPDDILIEIFDAPTLRGIIPVPEATQSQHTLQVIRSAEIAVLNKTRFYSLLTEHNLWEPFARHLQLVASTAAEALVNLVSPTVYQQVSYQLYELMSKPQALRESITAESFIRSKTRFSRTSIMNVLSALKKGGYITIEDGHLMAIKSIPAHY